MTAAEILLDQVREACARLGIQPSTFGRLAVNDGKLVPRLEQGGRVTRATIERVHRFIEEKGAAPAGSLRGTIPGQEPEAQPEHVFRFFDNRQKYQMFVGTSSEKQVIADLALDELERAELQPPAIRIFDSGAGDGTALARLLRGIHRRHPSAPVYAVAQEVSMENVRLTLDRMHDRFQEHPATLLAVTNLRYREAPWLKPESDELPMVWHEVALTGQSAGEFEAQIEALTPFLAANWQARISERSGNPVYLQPAALLIYRADQRFLIEPLLPRQGEARADFDLVLVSHAWRAQASVAFKAGRIVAPLTRALGPGGRLLAVQGYGHDPGMEIVRAIWPDEDPFQHDRHELLRATRRELGAAAGDYRFHALPASKAIFRYDMHALPTETDPGDAKIPISTLFAAWNAATYVAQIEDPRLAAAMREEAYLEATRAVLRRHRGLWFNDEMFVISRGREE
jgi:SAM-dependent methyltransferase